MARLSGRFRLGEFDVAAVSDGIGGQDPQDWFPNVDPVEWMAAVGAVDPTAALPVNFGSFLVRGGGRTYLIDSGNGERTRGQHEGAGELLERIGEYGVGPDQIDVVLLTHLHGDHVGWNVREDGKPTFPNARYLVSQTECDYWLSPDAPVDRGAAFSQSRTQPLIDAGQLDTFDGEHAVAAGVTMIPTPGHTAGHCSVVLSSAGERLIILGDVAPHPAHLEHPDWRPVFDHEPDRAAETRRLVAREAAEAGTLLTGGHFPILSLGRLRSVETGFRWEPVEMDEPQ